MKLFPALALALVVTQVSPSQTVAPAAPPVEAAAAPSDSAAVLAYIRAAWDTLTRSMTDCNSLKDPKVNAQPVLYLPADVPVPADVLALEQTCSVKVTHLPRTIDKIGDLQPNELPAQGLLYLPDPYVVPGGQFNEMYGWDSYFIILGLEADHREKLAKGIVDNFFYEIQHYGGLLNANRTYYLTRSQPPFLTSMIRAVYEDPASFPATAAGHAQAHAWLEQAYAMAEKDYSTWTRPEHKAGETGLARYFGYGTGPVPEMGNDPSYYIDVLKWLVAHPGPENAEFLVKGPEHPDAAAAARLKQTSCDVDTSTVCMKAWYGGYRLSRDFYIGDRAMRESGFDPSFRYGPFSGATQDYAPVGLNCLLYHYERDMEHFALLLEKPDDAMRWRERARLRDAAIQRYLWRPAEGVFADYDFVRRRPSNYAYITSLYPLWSSVATREEAAQMVARLNLFERAGGLSTSDYDSGLQWDDPFGWAPTNWIVVAGLDDYGYREDALRISREFIATVDKGFAADGTIVEKYNVAAGNANVHVTAGYKVNQVGFGWTNGVYLKMEQLIKSAAPAAVSQ